MNNMIYKKCMILVCIICQGTVILKQKIRKFFISYDLDLYFFLYIYLVFRVMGIGSIWNIKYYHTLLEKMKLILYYCKVKI